MTTNEHAQQAYREGRHAEYRWLKRHPNATREDYARLKVEWDKKRSNSTTADEREWLRKHLGSTREDYDKDYQKVKHGRNLTSWKALKEGCSNAEYQWLRKHVGSTREDYAARKNEAKENGDRRWKMT